MTNQPALLKRPEPTANPAALKPAAGPAAGQDPTNPLAVPGLTLLPAFLTPQQQTDCRQRLDAAVDEWRSDLRRRVQHYGWRYDYKARAITPVMYLGVLPPWLQALADRLYQETGVFSRPPEQVIVNEYLPGQGIATHIDHKGFGPSIATISLLETWEMDFSRNWQDKTPLALPDGSCLLLTGPARDKWQHGIQARKAEPAGPGRKGSVPRRRRISLTFRTVRNMDGPNDG